LAAFVAWSGLSLAWSEDLRQGAITLLFFFLPFGLLAILLARLPWSRRWLEGVYGLLGLMAVVFAFVGLYQWANRDVFWNPKVIVDNAYAPSGWFYRVNSVFYDPSIYGRFLVVAILACLVAVLFTRDRRLLIGKDAEPRRPQREREQRRITRPIGEQRANDVGQRRRQRERLACLGASGFGEDRARKDTLRRIPAADRVGIMRGEQHEVRFVVGVIDADRGGESAQQRRDRTLADIGETERFVRLANVQRRAGVRGRSRRSIAVEMKR
jgi:hypothetical protein